MWETLAGVLENFAEVFFKNKTLQNINEPGGGAAGNRMLYGGSQRHTEKKARLSRSLTLPTFTVPGTNAAALGGRLQQQQQPNPLEPLKTSSNNFLYEARLIGSGTTPVSGNSPKIMLTTDDTSFDYRRKSSGGSGLFTPCGGAPSVAPAEPHIYDFDEKRPSGDGSVVISVTSPGACQIPTSKSFGLTSFNLVNLQNATNNTYGSSNTSGLSTCHGGHGDRNSFSGTSSVKRGSDVTAYGSAASAQLISNSTNSAIYRLARIINQTTKAIPADSGKGGGGNNLQYQSNDDSARRLSWERRDPGSKPMPRSSSIDSMVDAVWSEFPASAPGSARNSVSNQSSQSTTNVPSNLNIFLSSNRRESMLSPSSNRRSKQQRGISGKTHQPSGSKSEQITGVNFVLTRYGKKLLPIISIGIINNNSSSHHHQSCSPISEDDSSFVFCV
ncbi:uncharacterized protein LOC129738182 [Uranotaenia lowii]|uniref:uncharacterized protein LOC129738182 n=1 Tax=Uranotaenia lowii TaxID=190385 RepID=UPI00247AB3DB|nr:uncharacterized protein LOC129738182 [Uranotaenia lowii]